MIRKIVLTALIGLLTTWNVSAQTNDWSSKVSPLQHQQIIEQQVAARRAASGEPTETYLGALVKLAKGQNGSVLRREEIIATLSRTCKKLEPTLSYPNNGYGYGEVDAYAGLIDILGVATSIPTLSRTLADVTLQGHTLHIEGITEPTTVNVYTLNGQKVYSTQTADGRVDLPNLPTAVYAVQIGTVGSSLIRL